MMLRAHSMAARAVGRALSPGYGPSMMPSRFTSLRRAAPLHVRAQQGKESSAPVPKEEKRAELQHRPRREELQTYRSPFDLLAMPPPFRRMNDALMDVQRQMDAMMEAFDMGFPALDERRFFAPLLGPAEAAALPSPRSFTMDVEETDTEYTVTAHVPGFSKEDIKITLSPEGVLTINGSKTREDVKEEAGGEKGEKKEGEKEGTKTRTTLRQATSFTRSFRLPQDVRTDDASAFAATTKDGVLTLHLPKTPAPAKPAALEIPVN